LQYDPVSVSDITCVCVCVCVCCVCVCVCVHLCLQLIVELEARNCALQQKVEIFEEALKDEQYENQRLDDDLRLAVDQGV